MAAYPTIALGSNAPVFPAFTVPAWSRARALAHQRTGNPRFRSGTGARRRSSYEHQLDRIADLVERAGIQGAVVELERGHGTRRARRQLYAWELVYKPAPLAPRWVRVYRRLIVAHLAYLAEHAPGELGWARRQSRARAQRNPDATRHSLPRKNWAAFFAYRRVYDSAVRLLLTLDAWWRRGEPAPSREERRAAAGEPRPVASLIPAPRPASPRPTAEERPDADRQREQEGTRYRDQSAPGAEWFINRPFPGRAM